jgi:ArsR family transcriptional regulator
MGQGRSHQKKATLKELQRLAGLFRVLAEPNRLRILYLLMQRETCVCELLPEMGISQPLLSHHLSVLAESGLIRSRRQAQRVFYSVVPAALARLKALVLDHFDPDALPLEAAIGQGVVGRCAVPQPVRRIAARGEERALRAE